MGTEHYKGPQNTSPGARSAETDPGSAAAYPLKDWMLYAAVFIGGCVGTGLRYTLSAVFPYLPSSTHGWQADFHPGTLCANLLACLLYAGLSAFFSRRHALKTHNRAVADRALGTGLCGGLSTMSTLAFEGFSALHAEDISGFAAYMAATFILGIMSACLGAYCGKKACDRIGSSEGKREG